ncbi:thiol-disulfide oxidoreductase DCC family protein [Oceanobacillus sp. J11TS1]|uniref:thiol-disulfide oxidoreductase DCC family protein n=1 Tax=Oceanobacillus sp. J11TS1 TaxID=2807191 RepID=UPI001B062C9E|nr:thiol-disulfide oxidoreductase DCC family protein [Oceanobacillus sp. J11TS1]GIO25006.1 hypothetical protein J11TS1_35870 [Oceanobacillus sp. J11TS1]
MQKIILFDGECHVCDSFVQFILQRDTEKQFLFASLQSEVGEFIKTKYQVPKNIDSVLLVDKDKHSIKSDAALNVLQNLNYPWKILVIGKIFPRFLRDAFYDLIARNRYKWFGKKRACRLPTPQERERFVETVDDLKLNEIAER